MANKFVVALNKAYQAEELLSALGHVTAGLSVNCRERDQMRFLTYLDASGAAYPNISAWPFIVLRGNGGRLRRLRSELIEASLDYACYLDTMVSGGSDLQVEATKLKQGEELEILALATFGEVAKLDPLTKRFSVWKAAERTH